MEINIVRFFCAFFAGGLLSLSGSLIQGVTQNELAGPSTLGLNALIILMVLTAHGCNIFFGFNVPLEYLSLGILLISIVVVVPIYKIFKKKSYKYANRFSSSISFYILLGLCFNLFVGAIFSVMQFLFMTVGLEFPAELWYGNFRFTDPKMLILLSLIALFIYVILLKLSKKLRVLSFGNDLAVALKIDVERLQKISIYISFLAVGVVTCFFGLFAFVGLICPHLLRTIPFIGRNIRKELLWGGPICALLFAFLDLLCAQCTFYGAEIPVGMISALAGTFVLLIVLGSRILRAR